MQMLELVRVSLSDTKEWFEDFGKIRDGLYETGPERWLEERQKLTLQISRLSNAIEHRQLQEVLDMQATSNAVAADDIPGLLLKLSRLCDQHGVVPEDDHQFYQVWREQLPSHIRVEFDEIEAQIEILACDNNQRFQRQQIELNDARLLLRDMKTVLLELGDAQMNEHQLRIKRDQRLAVRARLRLVR